MQFMKKYESPEFKVLSINMHSIMLGGSDVNPVPGYNDVPDGEYIKSFEDISSDLFGGESFGGAEEW